MNGRTAEELMQPRGALGLPRPAYDGRSIANLVPSFVRALGTAPGDPPFAPTLAEELDPWGGRRAEGPIVVLLIDGLGWTATQAWLARRGAPIPAPWSRARPITTVFPTTTTSALASLSTGSAPAQHGIVGYRQYLPRFGVVADLLKMAPLGLGSPGSLVGPEWTPSLISGVPPISRRGVRTAALSREAFAGTGFTRLLYDGAEYVGYATASELAHDLVSVLARERPPELLLAYWDELDTVSHRNGPEAAYHEFEMERMVQLLAYVARRLPRALASATTLLVTGDHGQVGSARERQIRIDQIPEITGELAWPMAGDRRSGYFAARPGRSEALERALGEHLPAGSRIVRMEEALAAGLYGPPPFHPEIRARLGEFLALVPPSYGLAYQLPGATTPKRHLSGSHGGLDPAELLVPLIEGPLAEFGG